MKVSVVIPLYNGRDTIERAVSSVLNQTHTDFSLFIVNDGSTDGGEKLIKTDPRIQIINTPNQGPGAARNVGIRACKTDWVGLLNADDEWESNFLEKFLKAANSQVCAVFSRVRVPDQKALPSMEEGIISDYFSARLNNFIALTPSSVLLHRDTVLEIGGFMETHRYAEDIDTWFRLACVGKFYYIPDQLCIMHINSENRLTKTVPVSERIAGLQTLQDTYKKHRSLGLIPKSIEKSCALFMEEQRAYISWLMINSGNRIKGLFKLTTGVNPFHRWKEYKMCFKRVFT